MACHCSGTQLHMWIEELACRQPPVDTLALVQSIGAALSLELSSFNQSLGESNEAYARRRSALDHPDRQSMIVDVVLSRIGGELTKKLVCVKTDFLNKQIDPTPESSRFLRFVQDLQEFNRSGYHKTAPIVSTVTVIRPRAALASATAAAAAAPAAAAADVDSIPDTPPMSLTVPIDAGAAPSASAMGVDSKASDHTGCVSLYKQTSQSLDDANTECQRLLEENKKLRVTIDVKDELIKRTNAEKSIGLDNALVLRLLSMASELNERISRTKNAGVELNELLKTTLSKLVSRPL